MASYFVACHAPAAEADVHDRTHCPPACFLLATTTEYLGEFTDARQALAVARLRYAHARGCPCHESAGRRLPWLHPAAQPLAPT